MPVLSYGFGIVDWTVAEISQLDILVRKAMTSANSLHPRSAVERLYLPHRLGGQGLVGVESLYQRRIIMLSHHLNTSEDALVKMCWLLDVSLPSQKSICSKANKLVNTLSLNIDLVEVDVDDLRSLICDRQRIFLWDALKSKPLHGKFVNWCSSNPVDIPRSFHWLSEFVYSESESTILAIQDQVVKTRVYEARIMSVSVPTVMCRLCNSHEETIQHTVIHWHLCHTFGIPTKIGALTTQYLLLRVPESRYFMTLEL